jgi:hypothetical protein
MAVAYLPSTQQICITCRDEGLWNSSYFVIWNTTDSSTGKTYPLYNNGSQPRYPLAVAADKKHIWIANTETDDVPPKIPISVVEIESEFTVVATILLNEKPSSISSNGTNVFVTCSSSIVVISCATLTIVKTIPNVSVNLTSMTIGRQYAWTINTNVSPTVVYQYDQVVYTMPSTFNYNNISIVPPTGGIMGFLGIVDPPGWVIMDGKQRDNTSGIYNNLLLMGIGGLDGIYYCPPNYQGSFLRGIGTSPNAPSGQAYVGPSNVNSYQTDAVQDEGYITTLTPAAGDKLMTGLSFSYGQSGSLFAGNTGSQYAITLSFYGFNSSLIQIQMVPSVFNQHVNTSFNGNKASETRPYNYGIIWILKL